MNVTLNATDAAFVSRMMGVLFSMGVLDGEDADKASDIQDHIEDTLEG